MNKLAEHALELAGQCGCPAVQATPLSDEKVLEMLDLLRNNEHILDVFMGKCVFSASQENLDSSEAMRMAENAVAIGQKFGFCLTKIFVEKRKTNYWFPMEQSNLALAVKDYVEKSSV